MSSIVAVAGGTGNLGRAIVETLVASGGYKVFVLARTASDEKSQQLGAKVLAVDYGNVESIVHVLEENKIDVVISTIDSQTGKDSELALIEAANISATTKRFIPSCWGLKYTPEVAKVFTIPGGPSLADGKIALVNALEKTSLEYTAVINGFFLDYYGQPHVKSYLSGLTIAVDIANKTAAIPGSGNVPITFTYTFDIAKFISALLHQSSWEKESYIIGDKVTFNELLAIAEEARGSKFTTTYDSLEKLETYQVTELPAHRDVYPFFPKQMLQAFCAVFGNMFERGFFDFKPETTLNDQFPEIKAKTVRDLVNEAWKGK